mgnify:CR=1 FL=1
MSIEITQLAQEELRKVLESKNNLDRPLRLYIAGMGWGGPTFGIALDEQKEGDEVIKVDEFTFVLDEDMKNNFSDFNIDYSNNWLRRGFQVSAGRGGSSC